MFKASKANSTLNSFLSFFQNGFSTPTTGILRGCKFTLVLCTILRGTVRNARVTINCACLLSERVTSTVSPSCWRWSHQLHPLSCQRWSHLCPPVREGHINFVPLLLERVRSTMSPSCWRGPHQLCPPLVGGHIKF